MFLVVKKRSAFKIFLTFSLMCLLWNSLFFPIHVQLRIEEEKIHTIINAFWKEVWKYFCLDGRGEDHQINSFERILLGVVGGRKKL